MKIALLRILSRKIVLYDSNLSKRLCVESRIMGGFERKYRNFKDKNSPKWHYKYLFRLELVYSHYHSDNGTNSFFIKQIFKKKVGIMLLSKAKKHILERDYTAQ